MIKIALAVAVLFGAAAGYVWLQERNGAEGARYRLAKLERGPLTAGVAASGTLNAVTTVQVGSQISGQVKEIFADFNSAVKQDQVIARIDPATYELRVNQARADLDAAHSAVAVARSGLAAQRAEVSRVKVTLAEALRDLERKQSLVDKNYISGAELDKSRSLVEATREQLKSVEAQIQVSEAQVRSAQAAVKQRESLLKQAQVDLERTIIRAPVDGTVILRNVDAGQTVAASLQAPVLFTIARDLRDMQVEAAIDEADVGRLRAGQATTFTVDAFPRRNFSGEIVQIRKSPVNVQNVISYTVVISARNPNLSLLPGMTANVRIVVEHRDSALKAPNAALRFRPAGAPDQKPAAEAAQTPGAQALQQFRQRLAEEVKPDAAQQARLEEIFAELRKEIAGLREEADEDARRRLGARARAGMRARIAEILRPEQKAAYERLLRESGGRDAAATGRVWILQAGQPKAVDVRLGLSDGASTELLGTTLTEGAEVIVGLASSTDRQQGGGGPRPRLF